MDTLNLLLQFDNNYAPLTGVMLTSLLENNKDIDDIRVYCMMMKVSEENRRKFDCLVRKYGRKIKFLDAADLDRFLESRSVPKWRGSYATYYKLFACSMIDDAIDRLVYIDSDAVVIGSIRDLINIPLGGNILGMCADLMSEDYKRKLHDKERFYYNAGMIVFDVNKWNEENCTDRIINHMENVCATYPFKEQDILNIVLQGKIKKIPLAYNLFACLLIYEDYSLIKSIYGVRNWYQEKEWLDVQKKAAILHYCDGGICERPWIEGSDNPNKAVWDNYLKKSLWSDFAPIKKKKDFYRRIMRILYKCLPHYFYAFVHRSALRFWRNQEIKSNGC